MSAWRRKAIEFLPECRRKIEIADSPMALWVDLYLEFEDAVRDGKESLQRRFLKYAAWCISPAAGPSPTDASTAAVCAFYESIGGDKAMWRLFRKWFSRREFLDIRETFAYHLSADEYEQLLNTYYGGPDTHA